MFMKKIPFVDLHRQHLKIKERIKGAAIRVIDSELYIGGVEVKSFEEKMARWLGVEEICSVACATSGLFALLKSFGIGTGDEVITTVHTAIATAEAISLTGAKVVFCDIGKASPNIDPNLIEEKITPHTRAIIPVHLYGMCADMDRIMEIAHKHSLLVIEDCAQAQGAVYKGKKIGTIGDGAVFSFFPSKTLGGFGDGGAIRAVRKDILKRARMFSNHGRESKYDHEFEGMNSRLDAIQAAMLSVCLDELDEWNAARRKAATLYYEQLKDIVQIKMLHPLPDTEAVFHIFQICAPDRGNLQIALKSEGIETLIHYPLSLNLLKAYQHLNLGRGSFPQAETLCEHTLSLPLFPGITEEEIEHVAIAITNYFKKS
jgi:dTDP-4-amino-4,6-dideoxygalactose transaminase